MLYATPGNRRSGRHRRRWPPIALRGILFVAAGIAIFAGWKVNDVRHQRSVVAEVSRFDARIVYDYQVRGAPGPPGPSWLVRLFGEDFFADVVGIEIDADRIDQEAVAAIATLPHLRFLNLRAEGLSDQGIALFSGGTELDRLTFRSAAVTDAGLAQLADLKGLSYLSIVAPQVTDAGLILLEEMPNLTFVQLISTGVTAEGVEQLRAALPHCDVQVQPEPRHRL
jgi:hypothetical protein